MTGFARRKLYAKPTAVTYTQTTVDRSVDRLWLRVELRAAELGLTLGEVAQRMGISRPRLSALYSEATITREAFARLSSALEMTLELWERELAKVPKVSAEKMQKSVRRKMR